jgi:glycosyltransferase involved in cell wall biosynthesis
MIDVCICTHSPDEKILEKVLRAVVAQTLSRKRFQVLIIDNANPSPLSLNQFPYSLLSLGNVRCQVVREPRLGIAYARIRALKMSKAEAVVFIDDDNVMEKNFLRRAVEILARHPGVGCFSGKINLPEEAAVPKWVLPLSASLAVRDVGEEPIVDWFRGDWAQWVPACTASMVLRKKVAEAFLQNHASRSDFYGFGRKGRQNLMSGEDFLIALSAADVGLQCGYFPALRMSHYLRSDRFSLRYFAKLMYSFAITDLRRERYLGLAPSPFSSAELRHRLLALDLHGKDLRARFCYWIYQFVYTRGRFNNLVQQGLPILK